MKAPVCEIFEYDLPLVRPLVLKNVTLERRQGYIVKCTYEGNQTMYGECAPLPGFSRESLDESLQAAIGWCEAVLMSYVPCSSEALMAEIQPLFAVPSGLFGARYATSRGENYSFPGTFAHPLQTRRRTVAVNGLISVSSVQDAVEKADALHRQGFRAAKLKVGRTDVAREAEMTLETSKALGKRVSLRLDANQAWDLETALEFARRVKGVKIEYIEEPVRDFGAIEPFMRKSGIPVALDETLVQVHEEARNPDSRENAVIRLAKKGALAAFVLKPTLLGPFGIIKTYANAAKEHGIKPVVSSCFESGVGMIILARLAAGLTEENIPVGLDTYGWLAEDVLDKRFEIRNGALNLDELDACAATVNTDKLARVYANG